MRFWQGRWQLFNKQPVFKLKALNLDDKDPFLGMRGLFSILLC